MRTIPPLPVIIACVGLISACASPQHATSTPGTNPAVWTGAPAPAGAEADVYTLIRLPGGCWMYAPRGVQLTTEVAGGRLRVSYPQP